MISRGRTFVFVAMLPMFDPLCPAVALSGTLTGALVAGFDSYSEKYTLTQTKTLDRLNEFRTRINLGYLQGTLLDDYSQIEAQSLIGQESLEASGRLNLTRRFGNSRMALDNMITFRSYRENSNYAFANDFRRYGLRVYAQHDPVRDLTLRVADRLDVVDYEERTQFDYDYVQNVIEVGASLDRGLASSYNATIGLAHKSIPDTTEISYRAYNLGLEYRHISGVRKQIFLTVSGERRMYAHKPARSPFWSFYSNANIQPFTVGIFGLTIDNSLESYLYDRETNVFFDYVENRSSAQISYFRSTTFSVALGPTYGFLASGFSRTDEYKEIGGKLSVDYNTGGRVWLLASYEPGWRDYRIDDNDANLIFSDFSYHRILVFTNVRLWRNTSMNLFVNLEPEDHKARDDDSTTTLFSSDISYSF
ncbi:MAG: hypothetical protein OEN01_13655 [Candidatus Krumholzibacteria bacterium]|nr:hypothetical protein [Candidatus Krumholzibacteria bacterium]